MDTFYSTKHVIEIFKVSPETVRNWAREFASYFSDSAKPGMGNARRFTHEDMTIFALIADNKKRGLGFQDTHAALKNGERGEIPKPSEEEIEPSVSNALVLRMRDEVTALRIERDQAVEAKASALGQVSLLKEQLSEKDKRIEDLNRTIARLETKLEDADKP